MVDVKTCLDNAQEKMDMAIMYLEEALAHIRAGKASARLLDGIRVDSYGSMVPISNVAAITTPDARSIVIKPWDKSMFRVIEKAIIDSDLGIMPETTPSDEGLSSLYNFEFEPQFPGIVKQNVLGFQACVWTEMIPNERKFGQHVFPSLQAFSELAWGSSRNWIDFTNRLKWHVKWLNANGFYFTKPGFL